MGLPAGRSTRNYTQARVVLGRPEKVISLSLSWIGQSLVQRLMRGLEVLVRWQQAIATLEMQQWTKVCHNQWVFVGSADRPSRLRRSII